MDNSRRIICDWKGCDSHAANHLRYGVSSNPDKPPFVAFHGDYCRPHIAYIGKTFTHLSQFALGDCSDSCGGDELVTGPSNLPAI